MIRCGLTGLLDNVHTPRYRFKSMVLESQRAAADGIDRLPFESPPSLLSAGRLTESGFGLVLMVERLSGAQTRINSIWLRQLKTGCLGLVEC
jgi:hypothetical protein